MKTCFKKNRSHPGGSGGARDMRHHQMLRDNRRPKYSGKVGMRYFHRPRNKFYCPTVSADRFWSLSPDDIKDLAMACDESSAPFIGVAPFSYSEILKRNAFTGCPRY